MAILTNGFVAIPGDEAEGMVPPPLLPLLGESGLSDSCHGWEVRPGFSAKNLQQLFPLRLRQKLRRSVD